jgi:signal transduction histidine kinase
MNRYFERPLSATSGNAMATGTAWTNNSAPLTAEQHQLGFYGHNLERIDREQNIRLDERRKEREHIAQELHDTLFQGFIGASMLLDAAVEQMPADSPSKPSLNRALRLMYRVMEEGRMALQGLRAPLVLSGGLEQALCDFGKEVTPSGAELRVSVMGRPKPLKPTIQSQIYLIGREALVNALRHSGATTIEAEVEYLPNKLRVVVRDNGSGFDTQVLRSTQDSHWGLLGMHERAANIGAQLHIWSRPGAGTEVEISIASDVAVN